MPSLLLPFALTIGLLAGCGQQQRLACPYVETAPMAASGCFTIREQKLLVVEQRSGRWNFPAGGAKRGESPRCTAWRETLEETGLVAQVGDLLATMPNGFQLYQCSVGEQQAEASFNTPEIKRVIWAEAGQLSADNWRFPAQMPLIHRLMAAPISAAKQ